MSMYDFSGDALLTSLHVAKQVGICDTDRQTLTLTGKEGGKITLNHHFEWTPSRNLLFIYLFIYLFICLFIYSCIPLFIYLFICLFVCFLYIYLSTYFFLYGYS